MPTIGWGQAYGTGSQQTGYTPPGSAEPGLAKVPVGTGFDKAPQRLAGAVGIEVPVLIAIFAMAYLMTRFSPVS